MALYYYFATYDCFRTALGFMVVDWWWYYLYAWCDIFREQTGIYARNMAFIRIRWCSVSLACRSISLLELIVC